MAFFLDYFHVSTKVISNFSSKLILNISVDLLQWPNKYIFGSSKQNKTNAKNNLI